jgi:hypothetical protein
MQADADDAEICAILRSLEIDDPWPTRFDARDVRDAWGSGYPSREDDLWSLAADDPACRRIVPYRLLVVHHLVFGDAPGSGLRGR